MSRTETILKAAALLDAVRDEAGKLPLDEFFAALIAPRPCPEGMEERHHLAQEQDRASALLTQVAYACVGLNEENARRWAAWENAPGGLMEKIRSLEEGEARRAAYDAEAQLQDALEGRR